MSSDLENLYQQIILDHAKRPKGYGLAAVASGESHQVNPTCGDEITLRVNLNGAGTDAEIVDVSYDGQGCSISQASASVLTDLVVGQTVGAAFKTLDAFVELMQGRGQVEPNEDVLEDGIAFAGVAKYPARVKCALLGWMAFKDAVAQSESADKVEN